MQDTRQWRAAGKPTYGHLRMHESKGDGVHYVGGYGRVIVGLHLYFLDSTVIILPMIRTEPEPYAGTGVLQSG